MGPSWLLQPGLVDGDNLEDTTKQEAVKALKGSPEKSDKIPTGTVLSLIPHSNNVSKIVFVN